MNVGNMSGSSVEEYKTVKGGREPLDGLHYPWSPCKSHAKVEKPASRQGGQNPQMP